MGELDGRKREVQVFLFQKDDLHAFKKPPGILPTA